MGQSFILLPNDHFNVSAFSVESNLEMSILCCAIILLEFVNWCQMNDFGEQVSSNEASPKTTCWVWNILIFYARISHISILGCHLVDQAVKVIFWERWPRMLKLNAVIGDHDDYLNLSPLLTRILCILEQLPYPPDSRLFSLAETVLNPICSLFARLR